MKKFIYGPFVYDYKLLKESRKTLSLTVMPDMEILVKCPHEADDERVELFLKKKWFWLQKQLNFFKKYQRKIYEREYISGESYLYLGRQYKLIVKSGQIDKVSLIKGQINIYTTRKTTDHEYNKTLLENWYSENTNRIFKERYKEVLKKFDYKTKPDFAVRKMQKRWGSFLNKEKILLNPLLIHASKECIDYVITHELCHMKYKNHDKKFFKFLEEKFPGWEKTKEKLESYL